MNSAFWSQNKQPTIEEDTIIVDGEVSPYNSSEKHCEAMRQLVKNRMLDSFNPNSLKKYMKKYPNASSDLKVMCEKRGGGTLIHGLHNETDVAGRFMPFAFWTKSTDSEIVVKTLQDYCQKINKSAREDDIIIIRKVLNKWKIPFVNVCIILILTIVLFFFVWRIAF